MATINLCKYSNNNEVLVHGTVPVFMKEKKRNILH